MERVDCMAVGCAIACRRCNQCWARYTLSCVWRMRWGQMQIFKIREAEPALVGISQFEAPPPTGKAPSLETPGAPPLTLASRSWT